MKSIWQNHLSGIQYNGSWLSKKELLDIDLQHLEHWEKELFLFMKNWVNDDDYIVVSTSGSTGSPKTIHLKKDSMAWSAMYTCSYLNIAKGSSALLCLPVRYIGGKMMIVRSFVRNLNLSAVKPQSGISLSKKFHFVAMTPHQLEGSLQLQHDLNRHIDKLILGGSATPTHLIERIQSWKGQVYSTYGMTETSSHIALQQLNGEKASPSFMTIDPSILLRSDEQGRLIIKAPYLGEKPIYSNDIVTILDSRRFHLLGRMDNVINSGGIKLHPEIIEQQLKTALDLPFFIFGIPHQQFGQRPVLIYEKKEGLDPDKIKEICTRVLQKIERPVQYIETEHMILTKNGKINRKESYFKAIEK